MRWWTVANDLEEASQFGSCHYTHAIGKGKGITIQFSATKEWLLQMRSMS